MDLDALRKLAEEAPQGMWQASFDGGKITAFEGASAGGPTRWRIMCAYDHAAGRHAATFDPPTVLALIARTESAEAALTVVETERDDWRETAMTMSDDYHAELTKRIDAEAALAGVRSGVEALCDPTSNGPRPYAVSVDGAVLLAVDVDLLRALLAATPDREEQS